MESKILIDINYASREPQIVIRRKDTDDPRDKLVSMFAGQGMPGTNDGYCRIERYWDKLGMENAEVIIITPIYPTDMIKHIKTIAKYAEENPTCDTSGVPAEYRKIIEDEYDRVVPRTKAELSPLNAVDKWAVNNMSPALYKKWTDEIMHPEKEQ